MNTIQYIQIALCSFALTIPLNALADEDPLYSTDEFYQEDTPALPANQVNASSSNLSSDIYHEDSTEPGIRPKAFFLDTSIWPADITTGYYNIPVCWEKISPFHAINRTLTKNTLKSTWEAVSLVRFIGWGACQAGSSGIRITIVDSSASPRAALGTEGNGKVGVMLLNFTMQTQVNSTIDNSTMTLEQRCALNGKNLATCIQSTVIHEFGHVLGIAHEQNRDDDPEPLFTRDCHDDNPNPQPIDNIGSFTTFGNTYFTDYDLQSIMNYCRSNYFGRTDLTTLDQLAARVYYGQMPTFDPRSLILNIPRIENFDGRIYTATLMLRSDNKFQVTTLSLGSKPSMSPATLSNSGRLVLNEARFLSQSGHVNQVLSITLQQENLSVPGVYTYTWSRKQPTQFQPRP